MMDWTDRNCRFFHRLLTRRAELYTEMVTAAAILHGDRGKLLGFAQEEHPVAVQIGGSDPRELAAAARIAADFGYDAVNLNCGCPSDRVQSGRFGACLMAEPGLVGEAVAAMKAAVAVPVTVKCRIGIDHQDPEAALPRFVAAIREAGVDGLVVHARKAWLDGLSPKENRTIPPLDHGLVHRVKAENPDLPISINGGIVDLDAALAHLDLVDGVMIGRAAYEQPRLLAGVDRVIFGETVPDPDPFEVVERLMPYAEDLVARGFRLSNLTRHILGLFNGWPGARTWRRVLTVDSVKPGARAALILEALKTVRRPEAGAPLAAE